jgi:hypothetical protein
MTARKVPAGLLLLCALVLSAFAASSASAAGTTVFTCEPVPTGAEFKDEHCTTAQVGGAGFKHTAIAAGVATEVTGTNEKTASSTTAATPAIFHLVLSTVPVTITAKKSIQRGP